MDRAQRQITILIAFGDDPKAVDVGKPVKTERFLLHLAPHRIGLFCPAIDFGCDRGLVQFKPHVTGDLLNHVPRFTLQRDEPADDAGTAFGVQHLEGKVFQFLAHPLHAHPACKGCKNFHCFAGLLGLLVNAHGLDRAHVVQPVGQLDQDDAHILGHGHEQLAKILGLFGLG